MKTTLLASIISLYFTMIGSGDCSTSDALWTKLLSSEEKNKPFATPEELRLHLNNLSHYYAVVGRPRFGKRNSNEMTLFMKTLRSYLSQKDGYRLPLLLDFYDIATDLDERCFERDDC